MGAFLCSLYVSSGFGGRDGSEVSMGHVFPWSVLANTTLEGGRDEDGVARTRARFKLGFLLCSVAISSLSRAGLVPKVLEQKP